ncbi:spore germination protein [Bacillus fonticola]|uniref:spore germination protein n=1 Tax=Bacillus fonticola TaxID=2728853 RepID=UPI001472AC55|nr:spore germination protein [Bacillus fonticola]
MNLWKKWEKKLDEHKKKDEKLKQPPSDEQRVQQEDGLLFESSDFKQTTFVNGPTGKWFQFQFLESLVDNQTVGELVLPKLLSQPLESLDDLIKLVPDTDVLLTTKQEELEERIFQGYVAMTLKGDPDRIAFLKAAQLIARKIAPPEVEFSVIGPKEAFSEAIEYNIHLIRRRLPTKKLVIKEKTLGSLSKSRTCILYIDGIANEENVNTVMQRLEDVRFDTIPDSSFVEQLISDNKNSPFPQLLDTERPDRVASTLSEGKVVILVNGSPHALIGPTTFTEFFSTFEDYFLNWIISSFFRIVRLFAVAFSVLVTPIYVAALTYHYEMIPRDLLSTLVSSRQEIPLPPILEAIFLEMAIELLREAGARLPTKVGQTIGIVGGIVIGTASVEAGLTSNVLLIIVALAALASFTTPVYKIGNTIRLIRFPFLLFAQFWGLLGIVFCFCFFMAHLLRLTSLGRPFLEPIYPPRFTDLKDSIIRLPFDKLRMRPSNLRPPSKDRFSGKSTSSSKKYKDIDE